MISSSLHSPFNFYFSRYEDQISGRRPFCSDHTPTSRARPTSAARRIPLQDATNLDGQGYQPGMRLEDLGDSVTLSDDDYDSPLESDTRSGTR